jgi:hypothetical protein
VAGGSLKGLGWRQKRVIHHQGELQILYECVLGERWPKQEVSPYSDADAFPHVTQLSLNPNPTTCFTLPEAIAPVDHQVVACHEV